MPFALVLILGGSLWLFWTIRFKRNGAVPVLGSRPSETGSFLSLGMLTFRILPVRTQLPCWNKPWPHGKTTYWYSGDQSQTTSSPKLSINCQSYEGHILYFQLGLKMPLNDCRTDLHLSSTALQIPCRKCPESCEIINYFCKPLCCIFIYTAIKG